MREHAQNDDIYKNLAARKAHAKKSENYGQKVRRRLTQQGLAYKVDMLLDLT
jgi:hypothetical protein